MESRTPRRAVAIAALATLAALTLAVVPGSAGALSSPTPWDGANPFHCTIQNAGQGTTVPDPGADPYCVRFDKTNQNVTQLGIVDVPQPRSRRGSPPPCRSAPTSRRTTGAGRSSSPTDAPSCTSSSGTTSSTRRPATAASGSSDFTVAGQTFDPTTLPGFPPAYRRYFGPGTGGFITHDDVPGRPELRARLVARAAAPLSPAALRPASSGRSLVTAASPPSRAARAAHAPPGCWRARRSPASERWSPPRCRWSAAGPLPAPPPFRMPPVSPRRDPPGVRRHDPARLQGRPDRPRQPDPPAGDRRRRPAAGRGPGRRARALSTTRRSASTRSSPPSWPSSRPARSHARRPTSSTLGFAGARAGVPRRASTSSNPDPARLGGGGRRAVHRVLRRSADPQRHRGTRLRLPGDGPARHRARRLRRLLLRPPAEHRAHPHGLAAVRSDRDAHRARRRRDRRVGLRRLDHRLAAGRALPRRRGRPEARSPCSSAAGATGTRTSASRWTSTTCPTSTC